MRKLPGSDLLVSELCLGTMTFGEQNTKEQAFRQLDMATKEYGINFLVSTTNSLKCMTFRINDTKIITNYSFLHTGHC